MSRVKIDAIDYKASFDKDFGKAPPNVRVAAADALKELMKNPQPAKLRIHSLHGLLYPGRGTDRCEPGWPVHQSSAPVGRIAGRHPDRRSLPCLPCPGPVADSGGNRAGGIWGGEGSVQEARRLSPAPSSSDTPLRAPSESWPVAQAAGSPGTWGRPPAVRSSGPAGAGPRPRRRGRG